MVLAREMTREEIAACIGLGCEIEVFVHGALCMSVSGQCYLSAMAWLPQRQPRPLRPALPPALRARRGQGRAAPEDAAALSLRDLSLLAHVGELRRSGWIPSKLKGG